MKTLVLAAATAAAALAFAAPASAHIGLAVNGPGTPGSTNLFGFGVGHGCGTSPTIAVRILIPAGIGNVRPVAKPGWDIRIVSNEAGAVTEIHFTGGSLPDAWYDQFWIRARIDASVAAGATLPFLTVQECAEGVNNWLGGPDDAAPAPVLTVAGGAAGPADHAH